MAEENGVSGIAAISGASSPEEVSRRELLAREAARMAAEAAQARSQAAAASAANATTEANAAAAAASANAGTTPETSAALASVEEYIASMEARFPQLRFILESLLHLSMESITENQSPNVFSVIVAENFITEVLNDQELMNNYTREISYIPQALNYLQANAAPGQETPNTAAIDARGNISLVRIEETTNPNGVMSLGRPENSLLTTMAAMANASSGNNVIDYFDRRLSAIHYNEIVDENV